MLSLITICKNYFNCRWKLLLFITVLSSQSFSQSPSVRGAKEENTSNNATGNQYALVVGISKYHNIQPLLYADDDANAFKDFLIDTKLVPEANIHTLIDSTATRSRFYAEIKKIMDRLKENDRVIIYFAGHGDVDNDIDAGFLLGYNCEATPYAASDAIDISMLERYVDAITKKNVKVILISDACRSGKLTGGAHGAELTLTALSSRFKNTIKILSCGPGELSEETNFRDGGHGVFTYYLLQALYGMCDDDNNNIISKKEIDKYLRDKVAKATSDRQNPITEGNANESILDVIPELKQAMIAKAQNAANNKPNGTRSFAEKKLSGLTSNDSLLVKRFYNQIRDGKLNTPEGDNAYETFIVAKKNIANNDVVNSMKYDLAAELEDDVQPLLNRVTRGEFQDTPYDLYDSADKKLEIIKTDLITPDDYRYNDIKALQIYFNRAGYFTEAALKDLLIADSIHPNTAYINCEIARYYSRQVIPDTANAFKYLKKSMRLAPTWPFPYLIEGLMYLQLNMNDRAKQSFEKSIQIKNDFKLGLINLGVVYSRLNDEKNETLYYKKALAIEKPYIPVLFTNLGLYWKSKEMYDSALFYYRKVYSISPNHIFNLTSLIRCFLKLRQPDSSAFYVQKLKNTSPESFDDYKDIGDTYNALLDYKEASVYYHKLITLFPPTITGLTSLAKSFIKLGQKDSALFYLNKAESIFSKNADDINKIGDTYLDVPDYKKATSYYFKALAIKPNADTYNNIGFANEYMENNEEAKKYYKLAIDLQPDYLLSIGNLALLYNRATVYDSAIYYFRKAIAIDPKNVAYLAKISSAFFATGKKDSALFYLKKAENINIDDADDLRKIGDAYFSYPDYEKAIGYYLKGIAIKPNPDLYNNLGLTYAKQEKNDLAKKYYWAAIQLKPDYNTSLKNLASIYYSDNNYDSAITYYKKSVGFGFGNEEVYNLIGYMYQFKQEYDSATKYYQLAVQLNPGSATRLINLATIFYINQKYDSAIVYLKKTIALGSVNEPIYNTLAASFLNTYRYDSAIVYYKKAIAFNPSNANNYINLGNSYYLNEKYPESIPYYEKTLTLDSVSYPIVFPRLAYAYLVQKKYDESIRMYQKSISIDTVMANKASYFYNIACARSMQLKTAESLIYFDKALKARYLDIEHLEEDTDLDNIRNLPAFKKLIETYFKKEEIEKYPNLFGKK